MSARGIIAGSCSATQSTPSGSGCPGVNSL
jgi:hypothetical protein